MIGHTVTSVTSDGAVTALITSVMIDINMDKGKGYDNNDRLRRSNLSQRLMW